METIKKRQNEGEPWRIEERQGETGRDRERQGDLRILTIIIINHDSFSFIFLSVLLFYFFYFFFYFYFPIFLPFFIWKSKIDTRGYYDSFLDYVARNEF